MTFSSSSHGFGFWGDWPRDDIGYNSEDLTAQSLQSWPLQSRQAKAQRFRGKARLTLTAIPQPGKGRCQPWGENTWVICKH